MRPVAEEHREQTLLKGKEIGEREQGRESEIERERERELGGGTTKQKRDERDLGEIDILKWTDVQH